MNNKYDLTKHLVEGNAAQVIDAKNRQNAGTNVVPPSFYRFVILETLFDPAILSEKKIASLIEKYSVSNPQYLYNAPRNSLIAARALDGNASAIELPMVLYPFFPAQLSMPALPGEQIWVMFEAFGLKQIDIGYWFCKITAPHHVDDANHTHHPRMYDESFSPSLKKKFQGTDEPKYEFRNGRTFVDNGERYTDANSAVISSEDENIFEKIITETDAGKLSPIESIPRYRKRPGEYLIEGTGNARIVIGKDRSGPIAKYDDIDGEKTVNSFPDDEFNKDSGTVDIVTGAGRTSTTSGKTVKNSIGMEELDKSAEQINEHEGDPDYINDASRILTSQKCSIDKKFDLEKLNSILSNGQFQGGDRIELAKIVDEVTGDPAIALMTDKVRIIVRSDIEFVVTGWDEKDDKQNKIRSDNVENYGVIAMKTNGDIVLKPSNLGYLKLGGDDANLAVLCQPVGVEANSGNISAQPIVDTMGAQIGIAGQNGQFSKKVLIK